MYDRPPAFFKRTDLAAAHDLFTRLAPSLEDPTTTDCLSKVGQQQQGGEGAQGASSSKQQQGRAGGAEGAVGTGTSRQASLLTCEDAGGVVQWRVDRPAVVVSSTSWTPDEDFSVLLGAAEAYEAAAAGPGGGQLPDVVFLITGGGRDEGGERGGGWEGEAGRGGE